MLKQSNTWCYISQLTFHNFRRKFSSVFHHTVATALAGSLGMSGGPFPRILWIYPQLWKGRTESHRKENARLAERSVLSSKQNSAFLFDTILVRLGFLSPGAT